MAEQHETPTACTLTARALTARTGAGLLAVSLLTATVPSAALAAPTSSTTEPPASQADPQPPTSDTPTSDTPTSDTPTSDTPTSDTPTSDTPPSDVSETTPEPSQPDIADGTQAPASAADPDEARAAKAYQEGSDAYELGRFAEAAAKFGTAWELSHKAPLLYNLGQAHWRWFSLDPDIEHLRQARLFFTNYDKRMRLTQGYDAAEIEANLKAIEDQIEQEQARIDEANRPVLVQSAALTDEEVQREHRRRTTKALNISGITMIVVGAVGLGTGLGALGSRAVFGAVLKTSSGNEDTMFNVATADEDQRRRDGYLLSGQIAFGALIAGAIIFPVGVTLRTLGARLYVYYVTSVTKPASFVLTSVTSIRSYNIR